MARRGLITLFIYCLTDALLSAQFPSSINPHAAAVYANDTPNTHLLLAAVVLWRQLVGENGELTATVRP